MKPLRKFGERAYSWARVATHMVRSAILPAGALNPSCRYHFGLWTPRDRDAVIDLRAFIAEEEAVALAEWQATGDVRAYNPRRWQSALRMLAFEPFDLAWEATWFNTVVTQGANAGLTDIFAATSFTSAWYLGLITNNNFTAIAATDTSASHPGWTESVAYSNATRPAIAFAAASGGSIATASPVNYSINASDTIYGAFFVDNNTKSGTTGNLYSAGQFTGGNQSVDNGDTLAVTASQSL